MYYWGFKCLLGAHVWSQPVELLRGYNALKWHNHWKKVDPRGYVLEGEIRTPAPSCLSHSASRLPCNEQTPLPSVVFRTLTLLLSPLGNQSSRPKAQTDVFCNTIIKPGVTGEVLPSVSSLSYFVSALTAVSINRLFFK